VNAPSSPTAPGLAGGDATLPHDLRRLAYWISLAAAAGGLGGALVGGIGGRFAMYLLRLTSDESVKGLESDDGFTIGRFDLSDTLQLVAVTTVMGSIVGLIMVFGRPFFPRRGMPLAWCVAGALLGGSLFIHSDGVDFTALEPHWFAILLFILVPALGALAIALLIDLYHRFWWRHRPGTAVAAVAAIPGLIFIPVGIATAIVAAACLLAMRSPEGREFAAWMPARVAALVVFVLLVGLGTVGLVRDMQAIL
jgi:hypothetical protein